ncbi:CBS domain-containing protein [Paraburkholderia nemoris]|uniref:CBS domain-containing protein n=1 Tax=Paraburkholderia nemoris TaxID=2793076 RepID=UPI0038B9B62B
MTVREAMSAEILSCFEDDPAEDVERIMRQSHVHRLTVLDRGDQHLVSIIHCADCVKR